MAASSDQPSLEELELCLDGETRAFADWTRDFVNTYYPDVGQRCYRVPALYFNTQSTSLSAAQTFDGSLLNQPDASDAYGDLAHTLVLDSLEQLGQQLMDKHHSPLFVISSLQYENYLAKLKAPSKRRRRKGGAPQPATQGGDKNVSDTLPQRGRHRTDGSVPEKPQKSGSSQGTRGGSNTAPSCRGKKSYLSLSGGANDKDESQTPPEVGREYESKLPPNRESESSIPAEECRENGSKVRPEDDRVMGSTILPEDGRNTESRILPEDGREIKSQIPPKNVTESGSTISPEDDGTEMGPKIPHQGSRQEESEVSVQGTRTGGFKSPPLQGSSQKGSEPPDKDGQLQAPAGAEKPKSWPQSGQCRPPSQGSCQGACPTGSNTQSSGGARPQMSQQLPPTPHTRGEIDVLVLSQTWGVVLIEVKSTGMVPYWKGRGEEELVSAVRQSVQRASEQVRCGRDVFTHIMPDLTGSSPQGATGSSALPVTMVVALPAVRRCLLQKALAGEHVDPGISFLCREDLSFRADDCTSPAVYRWWSAAFPVMPRTAALTLEDLKKIVGRVCGLLSIVSVWTRSRLRVEIRTTAQAISEAGDRVSDIVLLPRQASLLAQPSVPRVCLVGPMGSGKTLLLQLKGRQWLQEGRRVVVLTTRYTARGRAVGHVLEEAIRRDGEAAGSVERYGVSLLEFDGASFRAQLEEHGPASLACFLLDELSIHQVSVIIEELKKTFPSNPIWFTAVAVTDIPHSFRCFRLAACLRSPPSVQLMLKELDLNPFHEDVYTTRSAARGLPCDGPKIVFLHHREHNAPCRPYACEQCAHDLVEFLRGTLMLKIPAEPSEECTTTDTTTTEVTETSDTRNPQGSTTPNAKLAHGTALSFRDILILVCLPIPHYERRPNGRWKSSIIDVLRFCKYVISGRFLSTLKELGVPVNPIVDSTSAEIGMPPRDEVIITDVTAVPSLERKVIFFLPGGPKLTESEADSSTVDFLFHALAEKPSNTSSESSKATSNPPRDNPNVPSQSTVQKMTGSSHPECQEPHVAAPQVFSPLPTMDNSTALETVCAFLNQAAQLQSLGTLPTKEETKLAFRMLFGDTMILDMKALEGDDASVPQLEEEDGLESTGAISQKTRMGSEMRGDNANIAQAFRNYKRSESLGLLSSASELSTFLTPDVGDEYGGREEELLRIRNEVSQLSMDDQDSVFMAASRCVSQFVVLMP